MDLISLQGKTNFFEKRVTEYQKNINNNHTFELDEDFWNKYTAYASNQLTWQTYLDIVIKIKRSKL